MKLKAIIIGSGIAGLTAAAYLIRAGYLVAIYEQFSEIGGVTATIKQDNKQMAQVIVRSLVAQIQGQETIKKLLIDGFVIDSSNADEYAE